MKAIPDPRILALSTLYAVTFLVLPPRIEFMSIFVSVVLPMTLIWLSIIDWNTKVIPDLACFFVFVLGISIQFERDIRDLWLALAVAVVLLAVLWLIGEIYWRSFGIEALGFGDVKLIAAGVVCVGPIAIWKAIALACVGGIVVTLLTRKPDGEQLAGIPFGPFLAYGLYLTFLLGVDR